MESFISDWIDFSSPVETICPRLKHSALRQLQSLLMLFCHTPVEELRKIVEICLFFMVCRKLQYCPIHFSNAVVFDKSFCYPEST